METHRGDFQPFGQALTALLRLAPAKPKGSNLQDSPARGIFGGRDRVRTCDPLLAKQVLSQLSYTPTVASDINSKASAAY